MKIAIDTNLLVYAEGLGDAGRRLAAEAQLNRLVAHLVLPAQGLGELYNVLTRKGGQPPEKAHARALQWVESLEVPSPPADLMLTALALAATKKLGVWDAAMLAAAEAAGCGLFLSEDLQHGAQAGGVVLSSSSSSLPAALSLSSTE